MTDEVQLCCWVLDHLGSVKGEFLALKIGILDKCVEINYFFNRQGVESLELIIFYSL